MSEFKINKDKVQDSTIKCEAFCFWGEHDYEDESGYPMRFFDQESELEEVFGDYDVYAIKVTVGRKANYYVKRGKHGHLFNPIGMYSEGTNRKQMRHAGKPEWSFVITSEKIFGYYINFLKTKNIAWLRNAEREV